MTKSAFSRRRLVFGFGGVGAMALLAACAAPAPTATPVPAKPAEKPAAPAPAAAAPTTAPAAAAKPAEKPAAPAAAPAASKPGTAAPTVLRLHARSGPEDDMWAEMLPKFGAANNAEVKLEQVPGGEHIQKLQTLVAGGQLGDVIHVFTGDSSFQLFFSSGVVTGIDQYIAQDKFEMSQFYKFTADGTKVDGKYGGLPFKGHPSRVGIFYNRNLFEAAGVPLPTNDMTYDQLVEAAKKLHKASGADVQTYGWSNPGRDSEFYIILARMGGGDLYSPDGKKSRMNEADAQWGWNWTSDMFNTHKVGMNPLATNPAPSDLFLSGKLAIFRANVGTKAAYANIKDFKWGMSVAPKGPKGQRGSLAATDVVAMTKFSKTPDLAWALLKHITSKEAGIALGKQTGARSATPGGRPDVYESPDLLNLPYPEGVQQNTMIAMKEAEPYLQPDNFRGPEVQRAIDPLYEGLVLGKNKPDAAYFGQLHQAIQDILDKPRP
jgi:multiple sugar transport system substrate-binding protein